MKGQVINFKSYAKRTEQLLEIEDIIQQKKKQRQAADQQLLLRIDEIITKK